jgi:hypothetical protein
MKSYIKIIGPPVGKTIGALEKIAIDMPEVCVMSIPLEFSMGILGSGHSIGTGSLDDPGRVNSYFDAEMPKERCSNIISKSGENLGEYDFYFEWFETPSMKDVMLLIGKIDSALKRTGANYTITTK